jgi:hypothetical protein
MDLDLHLQTEAEGRLFRSVADFVSCQMVRLPKIVDEKRFFYKIFFIYLF